MANSANVIGQPCRCCRHWHLHLCWPSTRNPTGYQKGPDTAATDAAVNGRVATTLQKVTNYTTTILAHKE